MGLEDTVDEEAQWSCDVDCFVRDASAAVHVL